MIQDMVLKNKIIVQTFTNFLKAMATMTAMQDINFRPKCSVIRHCYAIYPVKAPQKNSVTEKKRTISFGVNGEESFT